MCLRSEGKGLVCSGHSDTNPTQKNKMEKTFNYMQVFTTRLALRSWKESEGKMHLTNPTIVKRSAVSLLASIGYPATARTRWETLYNWFEESFGKQMDEQEALRKKSN